MEQELLAIFNEFDGGNGITITVLQKIQEKYSFLPAEALEKMSDYFNIPLSEIYGVATFYRQFRFNKPGKYMIRVCHGTACHINGATEISGAIEEYLGIKSGDTTPDSLFSLENVACLGCCSLAPVIMINDQVYGQCTPVSVIKIIKEFSSGLKEKEEETRS